MDSTSIIFKKGIFIPSLMEDNKMKQKILIAIPLFIVFVTMLNLVAASNNYNLEVSDVSPTNLVPGEKDELSFTIENTGNMDLKNIIFSWEEKTGNILPVGSSNTKSLDKLNEGDDETFDFDVFTSASAEPGLYELTFTIKFNNENGTVSEASKAGIIVGGQTDFDVSVSDVSSDGIVLSIANIGKNPANSVTVALPEQTGMSVSGSSSSIIGNLDKDDYSVASFQAVVRGSSNLKVEIQYTDTTGARQIVTKNVQVQSTQSYSTLSSSTSASTSTTGFASRNTTTSNSNNWMILAFIFSGILIIILIVVIIKRSKRKDETN